MSERYAHAGFRGRIGVARVDITPPNGIYARNWGAAVHDTSEGVHRPLTATAMTIDGASGGAPLALVALDLGWWRTARDEQRLRRTVLQALDLPEAHLMLQFSHTHAGPALCSEDIHKPGGALVPAYLDAVAERLVEVVSNGLEAAEPAVLEWSFGACTLAKNRDLPDPDSPRFLSGFNPAATADDTLLVGRATADDGRVLATLVNYACHPTTLAWQNRLISPDFVGSMRELVEAEAGGLCLYLQGASGELAPAHQYTGDTGVADRHGRQLGYAVLSTLAGMLPSGQELVLVGSVESGAPLAHWQPRPVRHSGTASARLDVVDLDLKPVAGLAEIDREIAACGDRVLLERLNRERRIREGLGDGPAAGVPLWLWRLGDCLLVGHPNEAYSDLQTGLRAAFPRRAIVVMNVVNGHFGYLPPAALYGRDLYPVWQTPFAEGGLERLIAACLQAAEAWPDRPAD